MANEINIQATLTVQRFSPAMQGSGSKDINQTNKRSIANIQNISNTAAETLSLGEITAANLGYLFVKNLDASNYVELALNDFTQIFAKLRAGEFCLFPVKESITVYAKANTAAVDVQVVAAEI